MTEPKEPGAMNELETTPKEVERKFVINVELIPADIDIKRVLDIVQAYIVIADDGSEIRVRRTKADDTTEPIFELTTKTKGGLSRGEKANLISEPLFEASRQTAVGNIIHKTRMEIPYGEHLIELDVYRDSLDGMVVAEVEFTGSTELEAIAAASEFMPPDWFGLEVTVNKAFKNQSLALYGAPA